MMTRHGVPEVRSTGLESRAKNPFFLSVNIPPQRHYINLYGNFKRVFKKLKNRRRILRRPKKADGDRVPIGTLFLVFSVFLNIELICVDACARRKNSLSYGTENRAEDIC